MDRKKLSPEEKETLLRLARQTLEKALRGEKDSPPTAPVEESPLLQADGACFVTLTQGGRLRGCIGSLEAYRPLIDDVREHALDAAFNDPRFPPLRADELDQTEIEISRLTPPTPLVYDDADDLLSKLRPGVDGVILKDGFRRATFLPQVWEKIPDRRDFLGELCRKMGASPNLWQRKKLEVFIYQVDEFHEH